MTEKVEVVTTVTVTRREEERGQIRRADGNKDVKDQQDKDG